MNYFSMFSGIGGFEVGIQKAHQKIREYISKPTRSRKCLRHIGNKPNNKMQWSKTEQQEYIPENIGYSEIDKYATSIYRHHYPKHQNYGDAKKIKAEELPRFDWLVGGFPCQAFSIAGKRLGFQDTRGTLFYEIARILKAKKPGHFLLENVKGLLSHDNGGTFKTIILTLAEVGYCVEWEVLNSKNFGVPQNRERVFIVGHLGGFPRQQVFPLGQVGGVSASEDGGEQEGEEGVRGCVTSAIDARYGALRNSGETYIANTLDATYHKRKSFTNHVWSKMDLTCLFDGGNMGQRVYDSDGCATSIRSQGGGQGAKTGLYLVAPNKKLIDLSNTPKTPFQLKEVRTEKGKHTRREIRKKEGIDSTLRGQDDKMYIPKTDNVANCITTGKENIEKWTFDGIGIRRLTPLECERLQGFEDGWTAQGMDENGKAIEISDTQRYKCLGNAVTTNVVEAIMERIILNGA